MLQRRAFAITGLCMLLCACGKAPQDGQLKIEDAWIRLPAVPGRPGAAYFTIVAGGDAVSLRQVASPAAERIELHESGMKDGVMRMVPIANVDVPKHGKVEFKPGGRHAMLFGIDPAVKPGSQVSLTFSFPAHAPVVAAAEVRAAGDSGHDGH